MDNPQSVNRPSLGLKILFVLGQIIILGFGLFILGDAGMRLSALAKMENVIYNSVPVFLSIIFSLSMASKLGMSSLSKKVIFAALVLLPYILIVAIALYLSAGFDKAFHY
jgi:hypothetical protein